jgi:hypothetical protein
MLPRKYLSCTRVYPSSPRCLPMILASLASPPTYVHFMAFVCANNTIRTRRCSSKVASDDGGIAGLTKPLEPSASIEAGGDQGKVRRMASEHDAVANIEDYRLLERFLHNTYVDPSHFH